MTWELEISRFQREIWLRRHYPVFITAHISAISSVSVCFRFVGLALALIELEASAVEVYLFPAREYLSRAFLGRGRACVSRGMFVLHDSFWERVVPRVHTDRLHNIASTALHIILKRQKKRRYHGIVFISKWRMGRESLEKKRHIHEWISCIPYR